MYVRACVCVSCACARAHVCEPDKLKAHRQLQKRFPAEEDILDVDVVTKTEREAANLPLLVSQLGPEPLPLQVLRRFLQVRHERSTLDRSEAWRPGGAIDNVWAGDFLRESRRNLREDVAKGTPVARQRDVDVVKSVREQEQERGRERWPLRCHQS